MQALEVHLSQYHSVGAAGVRTYCNGWHSVQLRYEELFDHFVLTEEAGSWNEFLAWFGELEGSWCFRGQCEASWLLETLLDRKVRVEYSAPNTSGVFHLDREAEERELLFRFRQRAHRYIRHLPPTDDLSSWLALMQHYGVPTRLLDWTLSPYVAMYFAVEEEPKRPDEMYHSVWAIDLDWLAKKTDEAAEARPGIRLSRDPKNRAEQVNGLLAEREKSVILRIDPARTDERMVAQQGLFLCKLRDQAPFYSILTEMMCHPETTEKPVVRKLKVKRSQRVEFLKNLRLMNIHRASLFPGLDGFGQSLKLDLEIRVKDRSVDAASAAKENQSK